MTGDPKRTFDIDYARILAKKLQTVPAWKDMAQACNEVLGQEVDARRRRLEKIRDSVKHRRGDTLSNFNYTPDSDKPAVGEVSKQPVDIPVGYRISTGTVRNVIRNLALANQPDGTDYLDVQFTYNDEVCRWLKPVSIPQERDTLLKNSYIMGFDFFNTKLSDEDLERLYETIQQYWPESGSDDNFMKYIGFVKNTRFNLVALWTEGDDVINTSNPNANANYPYLEPFDANRMKSVIDGGNNWQTSHVEISYDLAQFNEFYSINLDDLEQLFYYFAPIILVLQRISGTLEVDTPVYGVSVVDATQYQHDILKPATDIVTLIYDALVVSATSYNAASLNTTHEGCSGISSKVNLQQGCFDFVPYLVATGIV